MSEPAHMWNYWKEKYGVVEALKEHYGKALEGNFNLRLAVGMIECGELIVDVTMQALEEEE